MRGGSGAMEGTIPVGHREAAAMSEHFASQRMHMLHQEQLIESQAARIAELEQKSRLAATVSSPSAAVSPGRVAAQPQQLAVVGSSPTRGYHQAQSPLQQQQQQQSYAPQQQQQQPYAPQQFYASSPARQPQQPQLALSPMQGYRPQQQQQQQQQQQPYPATLSPLAAQGYYPQQPQPQPLAGTPRGLAAQFQPQPSLQEAPFGAVDERDWIEISGIGESPYWFNRRTRERARSPPLRLMSAPAAAPAQSPSQQRDLRDASAQRFHDAAATGGGGVPFAAAGWNPAASAPGGAAYADSPRTLAPISTLPGATHDQQGFDGWHQHAPHLQPATPNRTRHSSPRRPTPQRLDATGPLQQPTPTPRTAMLNPPSVAEIAASPLRRAPLRAAAAASSPTRGARIQVSAQSRAISPAPAPAAERYEAVGPPRLNAQPRPRPSIARPQRTKSIASPVRHGRQRVSALSTPRRHLQEATARDRGFSGVQRREPQTLSASSMGSVTQSKLAASGGTVTTESASSGTGGAAPPYTMKRPNISAGLSRVIGGAGENDDQSVGLSDGARHPITPMMAALDRKSTPAPYLSHRPQIGAGLSALITGDEAAAGGGGVAAPRMGAPIPANSPHYMHKRPQIGIGLANVLTGTNLSKANEGVETAQLAQRQSTPLRSELSHPSLLPAATDSPLTPDTAGAAGDGSVLPAYMSKRPQLGGGLKLLLSSGEDRGAVSAAAGGAPKDRRVRFLQEGPGSIDASGRGGGGGGGGNVQRLRDGSSHPVTPKFSPEKGKLSASKQAKLDRLNHFHVTPSGNFEMEGVGKITTHGMELTSDVEGKIMRSSSMSSDMADEMSRDDWDQRDATQFVPIRGKMGQGAGGAVVAAIHAPTLRAFALKRVRCDRKSEMQQSFAEIHAAIEMEQSRVGENGHGGIVSFLPEFNFHDPRTMTMSLVLEFMNGGSLHDLVKMKQSVSLSEANIATVCASVIRGLDFMHTKGQMHRDIKPANILMSSRSGVKIADFGIVKETGGVGDAEVMAMTNVGTQLYMSPERIDSSRQGESGYSANVDIWSFGIVVVELVTGKNPIAARSPRGVLSPLTLFTIVAEEELWLQKGQAYEIEKPDGTIESRIFSDELCDFTKRCLVIDPAARASAKEMLGHAFIAMHAEEPMWMPSISQVEHNMTDAKLDLTLPLVVAQIQHHHERQLEAEQAKAGAGVEGVVVAPRVITSEQVELLASQLGRSADAVKAKFRHHLEQALAIDVTPFAAIEGW